jgi:hydroxymethylglutaryl-CoA lyase
MPSLERVLIRDVTLRDGLQDESPLPTEQKLTLYSALVAAGITELELTSFVRPDRVPALADAGAVAAATAGDCGRVVRWGLVLNRRGAQRALAAGLRHLQFVLSVSGTHNRGNAGRSVDESLAELGRIVEEASGEGAVVEATLATAFGCPHTGAVEPGDVRRTADRAAAAGVCGLGLADTIGSAVPTEVRALVGAVHDDHPELPIGVHLHDTRGLAIANALAALESGATRIDGSVGGLGGCPFAPGASGNLPLEDVVHALHMMGITTGIDLERLLEAAQLACASVGRPVTSHVGVAGPRFAHLVPLAPAPAAPIAQD